MTEHPSSGFAPALLRGLGELGPVDPFSGDLSLELGISLWMRRSGTSLAEARDMLAGLRHLVLDASGLDPATEPTPLVGRCTRTDVVTMAAYLGDLLRRAAAASGCSVAALVARVVVTLPERAPEALGA